MGLAPALGGPLARDIRRGLRDGAAAAGVVALSAAPQLDREASRDCKLRRCVAVGAGTPSGSVALCGEAWRPWMGL